MYYTARRVEIVKRRVRENSRRKQRCGIYGLSAVCLLLFVILIQTMNTAVGPGQIAVQGIFGAMLLREDVGGYVLVAVAAFTLAVVLTVICMRLHEREKKKEKQEQKEDTV